MHITLVSVNVTLDSLFIVSYRNENTILLNYKFQLAVCGLHLPHAATELPGWTARATNHKILLFDSIVLHAKGK